MGQILTGEGLFVRWGLDYDEYETGIGNFTVGIIEMANGVVNSIPAHNIQFLEPPTEETNVDEFTSTNIDYTAALKKELCA